MSRKPSRRKNSPDKARSGVSLANGSVDSLSSSTSTLPDFSSKHNKYTRGLLKGRHPRSFPKQSELWHHYKSSASRLDRVTKGHNLWNVVDEEEDKYEQILSPTSDQESGQPLARSGTLNPDIGSTRYIPKSTLHGFHVDTKGVMKMHYGMNIVLMNCSDEVLCVNKFEEVLCKAESLLEEGDEIIFKLIDLTEPTNPGPIEYGKPIWLQTLSSSSDNNIHFGFVLTSKLFGPPEMESTQLTQMPNKKEVARMMSEQTKAGSGKNKFSFGSSVSSARSNSPNDSFVSDLEDDSEGGGGLDSMPPSPAKKVSKEEDNSNKKEKEKKSSEMSEVCGGINVMRAYNSKGDANLIDTDMTRFRSRQASHLGCWTVQNALKTGVPSRFVQSCTSIYLSQDLYCLATSHGNLYDPWPRTVEVNKVQAQLEKKKEAQKLSKLAESPFFAQSDTKKGKTASLKNSPAGENSDDLLAPKPRVIPTFTNNMPHGCLRRVVERGAPYSHVVDRRCVWKFCVADNPRDLKLLSVKEQKAHKLLRKAKAGLNKSKRNRLGGRVHEGYDMNGEPLVGGEKFPRLLRNMVSQESLKLETHDMLDRRHKEEAISFHLRCMFEGSPTKFGERSVKGEDQASERDHVSQPNQIFRKPRAAFTRIRQQMKTSAIPKHEFDKNYGYTFGHEMLQIHQSFASVNNKVTGSIMKTSMQNALNNSEDMRRRRIRANVDDKSAALSLDESIEMLKVQKPPSQLETDDSDALTKKLDLLSLADDKVMLALQYQARLNSKVSIGNLFEDVLDDDNI
jgi:hypothetical protein